MDILENNSTETIIVDDLSIDDNTFDIDSSIINTNKLQDRLENYKIDEGVRNMIVVNIFLLSIVTKMYMGLINNTYAAVNYNINYNINYSYYKSIWVYFNDLLYDDFILTIR